MMIVVAVVLIFLPYWQRIYYVIQFLRGKRRSALGDPVDVLERLIKR